MAAKKLVPADPARCQAEIKGGSFMTLGPRSWERCKAKPTVIAAEVNAGPDGQRGSMSLCASCLAMFKQRHPNWKTDFTFSHPMSTSKQIVHIRRFPNGNQGQNDLLGTVERQVRKRKLYVPSGRRMCASSVMGWSEIQIVSIAGRDYVVEVQSQDFGDHKVGDLIVHLEKDDPIPSDLRSVEVAK